MIRLAANMETLVVILCLFGIVFVRFLYAVMVGKHRGRVPGAFLLIFGGVSLALYFLLFFDVGVPTEFGRVYNLNKGNDRTIGAIVGIGMAVIGCMWQGLTYMGQRAETRPTKDGSLSAGRVEQLSELSELLERGHITKEEFETLKADIIQPRRNPLVNRAE
jgi:Short C-terminal domain